MSQEDRTWRNSVSRPPPLTAVAASGLARGMSNASGEEMLSLAPSGRINNVLSPSEPGTVKVTSLSNVPSPYTHTQALEGFDSMKSTPVSQQPPLFQNLVAGAVTPTLTPLNNTMNNTMSNTATSYQASQMQLQNTLNSMPLSGLAATQRTQYSQKDQVLHDTLYLSQAASLHDTQRTHRSALTPAAQHSAPDRSPLQPLSQSQGPIFHTTPPSQATTASDPMHVTMSNTLGLEATFKAIPKSPGPPLPPPTSPAVIGKEDSDRDDKPLKKKQSVRRKKKKTPKKKSEEVPAESMGEHPELGMSEGLCIPIPSLQQQIRSQEEYQQQMASMSVPVSVPMMQKQPQRTYGNCDDPEFRRLMLMAAEAAARAARDVAPVSVSSAKTTNPDPYTLRAEGVNDDDDDLPTQFSAAVVDTGISRGLLMEKLKNNQSGSTVRTAVPAITPAELLAWQQFQQQNAPPHLQTEVRPPLSRPVVSSQALSAIAQDPVELAMRLANDLRTHAPSPPQLPDLSTFVESYKQQASHVHDKLPEFQDYTHRLDLGLCSQRSKELWSEINMG